MSGWWSTAGTKNAFLNQLRERAGFSPLFGAEPFDFDGRQPPATPIDAWRNLSQLEAVVEFYANFRDPWRQGDQPRNPGDAGYVTVSFREPRGSAAEIVGGAVVRLDGNPDLTTVITDPAPNPALPDGPAAPVAGFPAELTFLHDTLWLADDTARPESHLYRIMFVDNNAHTVTLDAAPVFPAGTSHWKLNRRPALVVVDSFGARVRNGTTLAGANATVVGPDPGNAARTIVQLDGAQALGRINVGFDTIYLASDSVQGQRKPWRAYRITSIPAAGAAAPANRRITVDGSPVLTGNSSSWHVPAGVSGEMPSLVYDLAPPALPAPPPAPTPAQLARASRGFDHYDALLFIVHAGRITDRFRWSTYTSRDWGGWQGADWQQSLSSLRGNARYFYSGYRSGNDFKNYTFAVVDAQTTNAGLTHVANDSIADARFYFGTPVPPAVGPAGDALVAGVTDDAGGKTLVRLHRGSFGGVPGTGSAGCLVSPQYVDMRTRLVELFEDERARFYGPGTLDAEVHKLVRPAPPAPPPSGRTNAASELMYNAAGANGLTDANWNDKLVGTIWVIRPDELPT